MGYTARQPILGLQLDPFRHVYLVQLFRAANAACTSCESCGFTKVRKDDRRAGRTADDRGILSTYLIGR
jgi:hypothetical protein